MAPLSLPAICEHVSFEHVCQTSAFYLIEGCFKIGRFRSPYSSVCVGFVCLHEVILIGLSVLLAESATHIVSFCFQSVFIGLKSIDLFWNPNLCLWRWKGRWCTPVGQEDDENYVLFLLNAVLMRTNIHIRTYSLPHTYTYSHFHTRISCLCNVMQCSDLQTLLMVCIAVLSHQLLLRRAATQEGALRYCRRWRNIDRRQTRWQWYVYVLSVQHRCPNLHTDKECVLT